MDNAWDETEEDEDDAGPPSGTVLRATLAAGTRLDKALATAFPDLSRARLQALIADGHVTVNGVAATRSNARVAGDSDARLAIPAAIAATPTPEAIALAVLFEDPHLLVIDKPAGMVVHPAVGHLGGTLVNALLHHCGDQLSGIGGVARPGIVHRLDKDTSGVMVVAKSDAAHRGLAAQLADRSLSRRYRALVAGAPTHRAGRVEAPIGRDPKDRQRMAVIASGKPALTHWQRLAVHGNGQAATLLCRLETGRTHQIRVHMAHIGHPVLADPVYGGTRSRRRNHALPASVQGCVNAMPGQALHAEAIGFIHPITGERIDLAAPPPAAFRDLEFSLERI